MIGDRPLPIVTQIHSLMRSEKTQIDHSTLANFHSFLTNPPQRKSKKLAESLVSLAMCHYLKHASKAADPFNWKFLVVFEDFSVPFSHTQVLWRPKRRKQNNLCLFGEGPSKSAIKMPISSWYKKKYTKNTLNDPLLCPSKPATRHFGTCPGIFADITLCCQAICGSLRLAVMMISVFAAKNHGPFTVFFPEKKTLEVQPCQLWRCRMIIWEFAKMVVPPETPRNDDF